MVNIVCFGDSITEGAEFSYNERWTSMLQDQLDELKPGIFEVHNLGIGGNTTAQGLDRISKDVIPLLPGVLLIQFGFNDANVYDELTVPRVGLNEFERNLREFHRVALSNGSIPIIVFNHSIGEVDGIQGNDKSYNDNFLPYDVMTRKIAKELKTNSIDIPFQMSIRNINVDKFVSSDQIHLSGVANRYYADIIFHGLNNINLENMMYD